jgi:small subunit ribosomal protein S15
MYTVVAEDRLLLEAPVAPAAARWRHAAVVGAVLGALAAALASGAVPTTTRLQLDAASRTFVPSAATWPTPRNGGGPPAEVPALSDLLSPQEMLGSGYDQRNPSGIQVLNDDDVEILSPGQKRGIRRMTHLDLSRWKLSPDDVGSAPVQIARLTARITSLAAHISQSKKDLVAIRRITKLTSDRRKLLNYLWATDPGRAVDLVQELGIRWRTPDKIGRLVPRTGPVEIPVFPRSTKPRTIPRSNQQAVEAGAGAVGKK